MSALIAGARPGHPFWWSDTPEFDFVEAPERVQALVIGAGYAGLSAALAAHDAGAEVVVLDAGVPGQGASTRNGGMFGAHPRLGWGELAGKYGESVADGVFAEAGPSIDWARGLIAAEGIECDLQQTGRIILAWSAGHMESLRRLAQEVADKTDVAVSIVERADLNAEIATERYFGGLLLPEHCAIDPCKFHHGLLRAALRRGIPVVANCPALKVTRDGAGHMVTTPGGTIRADKVILTTNGYTTAGFPWHRARVFPLPSFLIATEELPEGMVQRLAPGGRMMVETRARHSYYRPSPDGRRILFGGRASMRDIPMDRAAERLRRTMCEVWPELGGVGLSHVWTGFTGFSFGHMPNVGEHEGVHHAMGFSGSGTVMAPYLGAKAAWRALGDPRGETAYAETRLRRSWLHPFGQPHFLRAADLWYRFAVDPAETRAGR